jgi:hypothetical protein
MSNLESIISVAYHGNTYTVAHIIHSEHNIPILLDREIYKAIKSLDKRWYINDKNHVYCIHTKLGRGGDETYPVYLHDVVVRLSKDVDVEGNGGKPIIHINNIHFDNRLENLQFDVPNKDHTKNMKKKRRIISLKQHGIDVDNLPTYMWYLKPDNSHGDRFAIEIPNLLSWRSTASKKVSLRYKLEEAKKYLRYMRVNRPRIFESYSMNGDLTSVGLKLYKEYKMMIEKAGFTMDDPPENNTDLFLQQDTSDLTDFEIYLLQSFDPRRGSVDVNSILKEYQEIMGD